MVLALVEGAAATGAGASLGVAVSVGVAAAGEGAVLLLLPPLKSVTYQPEPFNWKPAAVSCLVNVGAEQLGHDDKGASDIFCSTSLANPQD